MTLLTQDGMGIILIGTLGLLCNLTFGRAALKDPGVIPKLQDRTTEPDVITRLGGKLFPDYNPSSSIHRKRVA